MRVLLILFVVVFAGAAACAAPPEELGAPDAQVEAPAADAGSVQAPSPDAGPVEAPAPDAGPIERCAPEGGAFASAEPLPRLGVELPIVLSTTVTGPEDLHGSVADGCGRWLLTVGPDELVATPRPEDPTTHVPIALVRDIGRASGDGRGRWLAVADEALLIGGPGMDDVEVPLPHHFYDITWGPLPLGWGDLGWIHILGDPDSHRTFGVVGPDGALELGAPFGPRQGNPRSALARSSSDVASVIWQDPFATTVQVSVTTDRGHSVQRTIMLRDGRSRPQRSLFQAAGASDGRMLFGWVEQTTVWAALSSDHGQSWTADEITTVDGPIFLARPVLAGGASLLFWETEAEGERALAYSRHDGVGWSAPERLRTHAHRLTWPNLGLQSASGDPSGRLVVSFLTTDEAGVLVWHHAVFRAD